MLNGRHWCYSPWTHLIVSSVYLLWTRYGTHYIRNCSKQNKGVLLKVRNKYLENKLLKYLHMNNSSMGRRKGPIHWECSINTRDRNYFWKTKQNKTWNRNGVQKWLCHFSGICYLTFEFSCSGIETQIGKLTEQCSFTDT